MKKDERIARTLLKEKFDIDALSLSFDKDKEDYTEKVKIFKFLFNYKETDLKRVIWNSISGTNINKDDFTAEENDFIMEYISNHLRFAFNFQSNINKSYKSDRIILRPLNENSDWNTYGKHLETDGDFELYTCLKQNKSNVIYFTQNCNPSLYFVIEDIETKVPVGHIGLHGYSKETKLAEIEYYIFKEHRNKGYAKKAIDKLVELAFTKKLLIECETDWKYINKPKKLDIDFIRAVIRTDNIPSIKAVKSCGFIYEGTVHRNFFMKFPPYVVDGELYYIDKSSFYKTN